MECVPKMIFVIISHAQTKRLIFWQSTNTTVHHHWLKRSQFNKRQFSILYTNIFYLEFEKYYYIYSYFSVLEGFNGTIFAYGQVWTVFFFYNMKIEFTFPHCESRIEFQFQTGSGKTYTITGSPKNYNERGIIPRSIQYIFAHNEKVRVSISVELMIRGCEKHICLPEWKLHLFESYIFNINTHCNSITYQFFGLYNIERLPQDNSASRVSNFQRSDLNMLFSKKSKYDCCSEYKR